MDETTHIYECRVTWQQELLGSVEAAGRAPIALGAPPEFGGRDDMWSPEHLAAAAVNSCIMLTFAAITQNSKVPITAYTSTAEATLGRDDEGGLVISKVTVRPQVTIPAGTDGNKVERILRMAERNCIISNSITATVTLEPEIVSEA